MDEEMEKWLSDNDAKVIVDYFFKAAVIGVSMCFYYRSMLKSLQNMATPTRISSQALKLKYIDNSPYKTLLIA